MALPLPPKAKQEEDVAPTTNETTSNKKTTGRKSFRLTLRRNKEMSQLRRTQSVGMDKMIDGDSPRRQRRTIRRRRTTVNHDEARTSRPERVRSLSRQERDRRRPSVSRRPSCSGRRVSDEAEGHRSCSRPKSRRGRRERYDEGEMGESKPPRRGDSRPRRSGSRPHREPLRERSSSRQDSKRERSSSRPHRECHQERQEPMKEPQMDAHISNIMSKISHMKRERSRGSEFTESTGKLSSSSDSCDAVSSPPPTSVQMASYSGAAATTQRERDFWSSMIELDGEHSSIPARPAPRRMSLDSFTPLPAIKKLERKCPGAKRSHEDLIKSLNGFVFNEGDKRVPGWPKFIPPKEKSDKTDSKSQHSKPRSAFKEVKDSSPPQEKPCIKVLRPPPPPFSRRGSAETPSKNKSSALTLVTAPPAFKSPKERKTPPPPPPPRKSVPNPPIKSNTTLAAQMRQRSFHLSDKDLQALDQAHNSLLQQSQSFHEDRPYRRRGSIISLDPNEVDLVKSHQAADSLNQSMILRQDSQQINHSRVNSLSRRLLSLHQDVGLDLSQSAPAGLDNGLEFLDMKPAAAQGCDNNRCDPWGEDDSKEGAKKNHRKIPPFFGKRNSTGTSNCLALVLHSSNPSPPSEVKKTNEPTTPKRLLSKDRQHKSHVTNMPYTENGWSGLYTGEVDADKRPHGKGKMKYENGIFCEGVWVNGMQDTKSSANRERIMSGFSSWKGQPKVDSLDKSCTVYGMDWIDFSGMAGKYTGTVNADNLPDGKGVMKYDFGLIAEGDWIKGVLNGGSSNGQMAGGATVIPGGTVVPGAGGTVMGGGFPGGMSVVGGGANTVVSGLGMMSICAGAQGNMGGNMMMQNPMINPYGGMGGGIMPQMQMGPYAMPYAYDPMMRRE